MTFGERSRYLRKEKGLSQIELAKALNISKACISMIEIGKNEPTAITLERYADFFDCTTDYLLGREEGFDGSHFPTPAAELTQEEKRLLEVFRKLNTKNRMHALAYAEVRLEEQVARA